jgi:peptidoglycan/xylan/chitin deacetylase (PgdA/CDA1 family)
MIPGMLQPPEHANGGALVVSLDFELAWGVRDSLGVDGPYRAHLLGAREVVPRLLDLFAEWGVAATWATVGLLFAEGRDEALAFAPQVRPSYANARLDPYPALEGRDPHERVGRDERDDPVRFAPSLVRAIATAPRQELASHTYAHFTALERGATLEAFEADLAAAQAIAAAKFGGAVLRSLVLPRHQLRPEYLPALARTGFVAHRGPEPHLLARPHAGVHDAAWKRAARLTDAYFPLTGANAAAWPTPDAIGLVDVPESRFLRPASRRLAALEPLRVRRIAQAMTAAARTGRLCHVWWHPHNFGADPDGNFANLCALLDTYDRLRDAHGFASLTMGEVAERARAAAGVGTTGEGSACPDVTGLSDARSQRGPDDAEGGCSRPDTTGVW